jgi:hypothetical protein
MAIPILQICPSVPCMLLLRFKAYHTQNSDFLKTARLNQSTEVKDVHKECGGRKRNTCSRMSTRMELACTLAETYSPQDNIAFAPVKINMDFIHTMFKRGNRSCLKTRQYHLELGIWLLQQVHNPIFRARALLQHEFY